MRALLSPAARAASTKSESRSFLIRMISLDRMSGYSALFFSAHTAEMFRKANYRSEEHTSELQSLMRISYAVFCLKKKKYKEILQRKTHNITLITMFNRI